MTLSRRLGLRINSSSTPQKIMKTLLPIILLFSLVSPAKAGDLEACVNYCMDKYYYVTVGKLGVKLCNDLDVKADREYCLWDLNQQVQIMCVDDCSN
jgi:hypothetical protein